MNTETTTETAPQTAAAGIVLAAVNPVIVHGWAKRGARGKRKTWTLREVNIEPEQP